MPILPVLHVQFGCGCWQKVWSEIGEASEDVKLRRWCAESICMECELKPAAGKGNYENA